MARRIRKQVHELTAEDLEANPCWEYASDEEGEEGQDEATARPIPAERAVEETSPVFVQAAFLFPNGRIRLGAVTVNAGDGVSGHQPVLLLPEGQVMFYVGSMEPKAAAVKSFRSSLRSVSAIPLPIRYVTALRASDGTPLASGVLEGLYWLADWRTGELRVVA
jgi:hypothetical protein